MVGDSPFDLVAGRKAGTKCAAVTWSCFAQEELAAERPDYMLRKAEDIIDIVQSNSFSQSRKECHVVENS
jgi:pyrophosphatase PpaX